MFVEKMKELVISGKLTLIIRIAVVAMVLASSLMFGGDVLAGPTLGGIGG